MTKFFRIELSVPCILFPPSIAGNVGHLPNRVDISKEQYYIENDYGENKDREKIKNIDGIRKPASVFASVTDCHGTRKLKT